MNQSQLQLFQTPAHPCSYFEAREARTLFADPRTPLGIPLYQHLIERGFRRSGEHIYRPRCEHCTWCIPLRIPVQEWLPRRHQRRVWNRLEEEIEVRVMAAEFEPEHFALFRRYLESRHADGDMADSDETDYLKFLRASWSNTAFIAFRYRNKLLAVAVTDQLPHALSAVYTFFDPDQEALSPGVFAILWQIQEARRLKLEHLYLGYWIPNCRKMAYKIRYQPAEIFVEGKWKPLSQNATARETP